MPITIPPFVAYQAPLIPIAGRWNQKPPEGDKFIPCEIDWGITVPVGQAVQFSLNSGPVEFTQIVAFSVDNGRNGGDVSMIFPDTGRQLTVPAYGQGVFPVFTNSLTFYVISEAANVGDVTEFEVLNSMPPPVSILPSEEQSQASRSGISINVNGSTPIIPPGINGTVQAGNLVVGIATGATPAFQSCQIILQDGAGNMLYQTGLGYGPSTYATVTIPLSGLRIRFTNGVNLVISGTSMTGGYVTANLYYSVP